MCNNNYNKTITLSYEDYLKLSRQANLQMKSLFGMTYEEIEKMKVNYENLKMDYAQLGHWHDEAYNRKQELTEKIVEFNSLPWYKRMFKKIEL